MRKPSCFPIIPAITYLLGATLKIQIQFNLVLTLLLPCYRRPLASVAREADKLRAYWKTLPMQHRLRFVEGLPEAEALVKASGEEGDRGGDNVVQDLVLAPAAWCFKVRCSRNVYMCMLRVTGRQGFVPPGRLKMSFM